MNTIFELQDLEFEWDAEKYAVNLRKHGVKFEEAAEVFFDPENRFGDAPVDDEFREYVIGYSLSSEFYWSYCRTYRSDANNFGAAGERRRKEKNMKKDKK